MIKTALLFSALCSVTAEWEMTNVKDVTTLLGVDSPPGDGETFYAAAGENGKGSGYIKSTNGGMTSTFDYPQGGMMDLDIAVSEDGTTMAMVGMGVFVKNADSSDFTRVAGMSGVSQSVVATQDGFGAAGQFQNADGQFNGVAVSSDNGASFNLVDIGTNMTAGFYARYAAFPSAKTWYVSTGSWPSDDDAVTKAHQLNRHVTKSGAFRTSTPSVKGIDTFVGSIVKTTDGGATFSEVLNTKNQYYFNSVHCADDNNCIAVAEGEGAVGYHTSDGGASWEMLVTEEDTGSGSSMMAAFMSSTTDFWFAGGASNYDGIFFHSVDGSTVTKETLKGGFAFGLTFRGGEGYAAVMGRSTCGVAKYNA